MEIRIATGESNRAKSLLERSSFEFQPFQFLTNYLIHSWVKQKELEESSDENVCLISPSLCISLRAGQKEETQILSFDFNRDARRGPRKVLEGFDSTAPFRSKSLFSRELKQYRVISWPIVTNEIYDRRVSQQRFVFSTANCSRNKEKKKKKKKKDRGGPSNFHRRGSFFFNLRRGESSEKLVEPLRDNVACPFAGIPFRE